MTRTLLAWWVIVPLAATAVFGAVAPRRAARLPPTVATWLLSAGSAVLAAASAVSLAFVVAPTAAQLAPLRAIGDWSARRLGASAPFEASAAVVAGLVLAAVSLRAARAAGTVAGSLGRAWRASRSMPASLVVVHDDRPCAYALPGWPGRIVASSGLLGSFGPAERRVVLAHEQAHLDGRHDLHLAAGRLAAACNPLLAGVPEALGLATERWADERAAAAAGDRALVARTIGKAAVTLSAPPTGRFALAAAASQVPERVAALLVAPPRGGRTTAALLGALVFGATAAVLLAAGSLDRFFDLATPVALARHAAR